MFDQQPLGARTAQAVLLHAHKHLGTPESLAFQGELQIAGLQSDMRIAFGIAV
jgi:hypothetical protein